ncbi:hypothetical protein [Halocalculus aciditolerans]|uniref:Uncharacterized protein n=1 Tax=Halocalculus aciditolerans TaxID=1383812 RepID=A0A830F9M5_9EURY|nr:hypothetical protein [Halocalculus aciditolerans]GGL53350.1 hypothetical protein GCM10009039_09410 [Halocalculus aciditolerans]
MRVRDWQDVLADVTETNAEPDGWRAVAGDRSNGIGEDLYLGHPAVGVYHLKTYAKNPYEVRGKGTRVARRLDDDLDSFFPEKTGGRFAVREPAPDEDTAKSRAKRLEEVVKTHADAPTTPDALFDDAMDVLESPAFGPMAYEFDGRPDALDGLAEQFEESEELLTEELEDLVERDDVNKGFQ